MILTRAQKVRLGAFVMTGTALFVGTLAVLAGLRIWEQRDEYSVRFTEDVAGLEVSAPVKYRGFRVGRVDSMRIAENDSTAIEIYLSLEPGVVLHGGTRAELASSGITGLRTINLIPGDPTKGRIEPGSQLEAGTSFVERITGRAEEIAVKVEIVTNQLAAWTNDENRVRFEQMVDSVTRLSDDIDGFIKTNQKPFGQALADLSRAGNSVAKIGGEADKTMAAVRDDVAKTLKEARTTLTEIRRPFSEVDSKKVAETVSSAHSAMNNLDRRLSNKEAGKAIADMVKALDELTELIQAADLTVRAGREDFVQVLSELRMAAQDIREFSRIIAQDPSAVIRGKD